MKKLLCLVVLCAAFAGCTMAGPYVTNVSSDGQGGLNIERCAVKMNAFMGVISTGDCTSSHLRLAPKDK